MVSRAACLLEALGENRLPGLFQLLKTEYLLTQNSRVVLVVKTCLPTQEKRDAGSTPGLDRSPGQGPGNRLQYSFLEIPWTEEPGELQSILSKRIRLKQLTHTHSLTHAPLLEMSSL